MRDGRLKRLLEEIRSSLNIVKSMVDMDHASFTIDLRNRYTLRLALVEVVEASVNLGIYILRNFLGVRRVEGYLQVFRSLVNYGVISPEVGDEMEKLTRLRNLIIHRYWEIDDSRIYKEAKSNGLKVILKFIEEIEKYASQA
ncbi:MAG: DUF86 domain-containing protein [archaeon GB-1867-035]|nr:DUF86 domain-containing protein [Candidatus Culexmicrobium profundum]